MNLFYPDDGYDLFYEGGKLLKIDGIFEPQKCVHLSLLNLTLSRCSEL